MKKKLENGKEELWMIIRYYLFGFILSNSLLYLNYLIYKDYDIYTGFVVINSILLFGAILMFVGKIKYE